MTSKTLFQDKIEVDNSCNLCKEAPLHVGETIEYGAIIIAKIGSSFEDGWFATLSPKTGGDPEKDFTIQLMTLGHFTHFAQINKHPELAKNYGILLAKMNYAMTQVIEINCPSSVDERVNAASLAMYGKCTNWKEKKEHVHIKLFPFRGDIGQPYTVDSSFGRKEVHIDPNSKESFVKMKPVKKKSLDQSRFSLIAKKLMEFANE